MRKYRRVLAAGLALTMGLGLAACGSKEEGTAPASDGAAAESGDELSGKLVYWSMWNDTEPQGMVWQQIADGFMEEHPDVEIEIQWCGRDNKKVLKPALEGGETIDVFEYPFEISGNRRQEAFRGGPSESSDNTEGDDRTGHPAGSRLQTVDVALYV